MKNTTCPQCKSEFSCTFKAGEDNCWCSNFPNIMPIPSGDTDKESSCFCPECLEKIIQKQQNDTLSENQAT